MVITEIPCPEKGAGFSFSKNKTMEIKTILAILYANNMEHVVPKAVAIDNGLNIQSEIKTINVRLYQDSLQTGTRFSGKDVYGTVKCPVIGWNAFKLEKAYLIELPNGKTMWVDPVDNSDKLSPIEDIISVEASIKV